MRPRMSCHRYGATRVRWFAPSRPITDERAGFSLIEILLAMLLMAVIALSILPLFLRAVASNQRGVDASEATNLARSRLETLLQTPFDHGGLALASGQEVGETEERVTTENGSEWWVTTHVRQFSLADLDPDADGLSELSHPIPGAADGASPGVHLKEIAVAVTSVRQAGPLGAGQAFSTRALKSQ